ncbi:MAG: phosphonatase-like hydrolase [Bacteroidia bacterium]|nr:phosphonatase-like hydrolase [Bacteroidia bacterium]
MIQMVVFDMAGTTVNEDNVVYKTLHAAVNAWGHDFSFETVLKEGAGKEKLQAVRDILAAGGIEDGYEAQVIYQDFIARLKNAYADLHVTPQEGAEEVFEALKQRGIRVVLNTGYNLETAQSLLRKLGWEEGRQIDGLVTASQVKNSRPAPDMIFLARDRFGIKDNTAIAKVGDSIIDIEEGQSAGCGLNIGVTTGAHTEAQLLSANPDKIIHRLSEILDML